MDDRPNLARRLRRIIHLVLALGAVIVALAFLPGRRVYSDANNCFGYAMASLGTTEHHHETCTPSFTKLESTEPAGGAMAIVLVAAVALAAGIVYRRPERWTAWLWVIWSAAACAGTFVMSFDLRLFDHVETLWPATVLQFALGTLLVLVLLATPVVALVTRARPDDDASGSLPTATGRSDNR